jgi:hypothetical protein
MTVRDPRLAPQTGPASARTAEPRLRRSGYRRVGRFRADSCVSMGGMTALLTSSFLRVETTDDEPRRPCLLAAAVATGWAVAAGLLPCCALAVLAWFAGSGGGVRDGLRAGLLSWLMGHGSGLVLPNANITVIPLGLTCALGLLLLRAGSWVGQTSTVLNLRSAAAACGVICLLYASAAWLVAVSSATASVRADTARAVAGATILSVVCAGGGILRGAGLVSHAARFVPRVVRVLTHGLLAGVATMTLIGSLLVARSLASDFASARAVAESLQPGVVGGVLLMLIGIAAVPNAVLCAGAFAAGPGFALGTGTMVAPNEVTLGAIPAFPLLAALPDEGAPPWWIRGLVAAPLVAGLITGLVVVRRVEALELKAPILLAGLGGAIAGVGFGLLTFLATGSAGPGRMSVVGPQVWPTAVMSGVGMAAGAVIGGVAYLAINDRLATRPSGQETSR